MKTKLWSLCAVGAVVALAGCGSSQNAGNEGSPAQPAGSASDTGSTQLKGRIIGDGSSTVFPITEAMAEEFTKEHPGVQVPVGESGTGGGFKKFLAGDTVLQDASRPIKEEEATKAKAKNLEYIELPVAFDGISIVVNPKNTWATSLTTAELKKIWEKGSKIKNWSQVRAGFPNKPLKLYGPGTDSGTWEYFNEEINGDKANSRSDYTASENDNILVQGVSKEEGALGYFGFAYYEENQDKLKLLTVDAGTGPVAPSQETIRTNKYKPLARPLFIYIERKAADRPEVAAFVEFYLNQAKDLVKSVGYVPLPDAVYTAAAERFKARTVGSVFADKAAHSKPLEQLYGTK